MGGGFSINIQHFIHVQIFTIAAVDFSVVALVAASFIHSPLFVHRKMFAIDEKIVRTPKIFGISHEYVVRTQIIGLAARSVLVFRFSLFLLSNNLNCCRIRPGITMFRKWWFHMSMVLCVSIWYSVNHCPIYLHINYKYIDIYLNSMRFAIIEMCARLHCNLFSVFT